MNIRVFFLIGLGLTGVTVGLQAQNGLSIKGGFSPTNAPIFILDGTGLTKFNINENESGNFITVDGDFAYSMSTVATGEINTTGNFKITGDDGAGAWNAEYVVDTKYKIKKYGEFVIVNFNHKLESTDGDQLVMGEIYPESNCTSKGYMILVDDWELWGLMSGRVIGNRPDKVFSHRYRNCIFQQTFTDVEAAVGGQWVANVDWGLTGHNKLVGTGELFIGADPDASDFEIADPVDTVENMSLKGSIRGTRITFSVTGDGLDKKVSLNISYVGESGDEVPADDPDLNGKIKAAAQTRNF